MSYKVTIKNNETNEIRLTEPFDVEWNDFMWTEGNYSCDCNRHLFFEIAGGNSPDFDNAECGEDKYSILCVAFENGDRIDLNI